MASWHRGAGGHVGKVGTHALLQMKTHIYGREQEGGEPSALSPCMTSTNMMLMRKDAAQVGPVGKSPRKRTEETSSQPWEVSDPHRTAREQRTEAKAQIRPRHSGCYVKAVLNHQPYLYPQITISRTTSERAESDGPGCPQLGGVDWKSS